MYADDLLEMEEELMDVLREFGSVCKGRKLKVNANNSMRVVFKKVNLFWGLV